MAATRNKEDFFWVVLSLSGLKPSQILRLIKVTGSAERLWSLSDGELKKILGEQNIQIESYLEARKKVDLKSVLTKIKNTKCKICTIADEDYPLLLAEINDPPLVLYYWGELQKEEMALGIVGTRRATPYGLAVAEKLSEELTEDGFTIVSGLARGIDSAAHRGALKAKGRTIAVLGSGLDRIYPPENKKLAMEIAANNGCLLTEFPPGMPPLKQNFPQRNRIISGLSRGIIVVEAGEKSGALITVDFALEQGRDVFAVPGPITSEKSKGTNNLISEGAKLLQDVNDIRENYGIIKPLFEEEKGGNTQRLALSEEEKVVFSKINLEPVSFEKLLALTGFMPQELTVILIFLEAEGYIRSLPGQKYVTKKPKWNNG